MCEINFSQNDDVMTKLQKSITTFNSNQESQNENYMFDEDYFVEGCDFDEANEDEDNFYGDEILNVIFWCLFEIK